MLKNQLRPLHINFELYSDTEDTAFKIELLSLMVNNVRELLEAAQTAISTGDVNMYAKAVHKTKSTVGLLDDTEFTDLISEFKHMLTLDDTGRKNAAIAEFAEFCENIITSLEHECAILKGN